jgi:phosphate starvation-inducible protein PhoH and related proteins
MGKKNRKVKHIHKDSSWEPDLSEYEIKPKTEQQQKYLQAIDENDVTFGIGTAGSGKSFLAICKALEYLNDDKVGKIILTRPVVEANEHLGFLPGTFEQKLDPYLQPLYGALYDLLPPQMLETYRNKNIIQISPLAYMRGVTFKDAFIILDEAQNTTKGQLKLFLTRLGEGSKMVVTGDITQIDLPNKSQCGLLHAHKVLKDVPNVTFIEFGPEDTVRHPTVKSIVSAYEVSEQQTETKITHRGC